MIERYRRPEMTRLWEVETKYNLWLKVELAVLQAQEALGIVPAGVTERVRQSACFSLSRIEELDAVLKHDVLAFLTCVNESVGEDSRWIHMGLTSSDVIDTALALQLGQAILMIRKAVETLRETIYQQALLHKNTACIGRSHGIHAEPTTWGLKLLTWVDELDRHRERLANMLETVRVGQFSGPVGTYSAIDPAVEAETCALLNLKPARISTQIISRDIHAAVMVDLALVASTLEKMAIEIRHLQRTEVLEVEEPFTLGQKGSSAMPHKRNPVGSENITGLARLIRGYALPMLENVALWHERDISHSSVERVAMPDAFMALDYILDRFNTMMADLVVYPDNMARNLGFKGHLACSQQVLVALVQAGLSREDAYALVQGVAMQTWQDPQGDFEAAIHQHPDISQRLSAERLAQCFDTQRMLTHVETIFARFASLKVNQQEPVACAS